MPAKKLCLICEATEGGVRKHLRGLLRAFSRPEEGIEIHALFGDRGEPGLREELDSLAANQRAFSYRFIPELRRAVNPANDIPAYRRIKHHLREIQPDVVHTHSSKAGVLGRHAAQSLGIKNIIHTPHVFPFQWSRGLKEKFYFALESHIARGTRTLVCVGESQREDAFKRGLPGGKLIVVRNGLELNAQLPAANRGALRASLNLKPDARVVGMVARLAPQKGVGCFVQAARKVLDRRPEVVFVLVGGGPLEAETRARLAQLRVPPENFRLLGHREDAQSLFPAFDLVIMSSLYEGLPYVELEAMAWGLPIVATDVLGSRDVVVEGQTGYLARVNDADQIAAHTLVLLDDENLRNRFGAAARARVAEHFSFDAFIEGHRRLYNA